MNAELIAVGSELLLGQISNTNGQYLSRELASLGLDVYRHSVVGDNKNRLIKLIGEAEKRANVLLFTGGLGPTEDDLTREAVAEHLEEELDIHVPTLKTIEAYFESSGRKVTDQNKKQALCFKHGEVFSNPVGMACGMAIERNGIHYVLLPGPPRELKAMFTQELVPYLQRHVGDGDPVHSRVLRFFGIGESKLEEMIHPLIVAQTNPTIAPLAQEGEVTVRLSAKAKTKEEAESLLQKTEEEIFGHVGSYFYGYGQESMEEHVIQHLQKKEWSIASAESLTGGGFMQVLTSVPGSSSVVRGSAVVYDHLRKQSILGVDTDILKQDGAVSEACVRQMAEHVKERFGVDVGISFSGVAGPDAHDGMEPGHVWIGLATPEGTRAYHYKLSGNRERIRTMAVKYGCRNVLKV